MEGDGFPERRDKLLNNRIIAARVGLSKALGIGTPTMLEHISRPIARIMCRVLSQMEEAAEARRRGDLAAADAAEVQALLTLRASRQPPQAFEGSRP